MKTNVIWINRRIIYQYSRFSHWKSNRRLSKKKELEKKSTARNWRFVCAFSSFQRLSTALMILKLLSKKIQLSVQYIIQKAIFMIKESEHAQFFWSFKCSKIVTTIKTKTQKMIIFANKKKLKNIFKNSSTLKRKSSFTKRN
jgi:hypothetical protein